MSPVNAGAGQGSAHPHTVLDRSPARGGSPSVQQRNNVGQASRLPASAKPTRRNFSTARANVLAGQARRLPYFCGAPHDPATTPAGGEDGLRPGEGGQGSHARIRSGKSLPPRPSLRSSGPTGRRASDTASRYEGERVEKQPEPAVNIQVIGIKSAAFEHKKMTFRSAYLSVLRLENLIRR
jgi:hypothetical protein